MFAWPPSAPAETLIGVAAAPTLTPDASNRHEPDRTRPGNVEAFLVLVVGRLVLGSSNWPARFRLAVNGLSYTRLLKILRAYPVSDNW